MRLSTNLSFIYGICIATSIFTLSSFYSGPSLNQSPNGIIEIDAVQAKEFKSNYTNTFPDKPKGFDISIKQLSIINKLIEDNKSSNLEISGFRFYHGMQNANNTNEEDIMSMVYSLDNSRSLPVHGSAGTSSSIMAATKVGGAYTDPCPPFCD